MIKYYPVSDCIVFEGNDVLTGLRINIIFNEQEQPQKRILMWNKLLKNYMYSKDAGLTWKTLFEAAKDFENVGEILNFEDVMPNVDLML